MIKLVNYEIPRRFDQTRSESRKANRHFSAHWYLDDTQLGMRDATVLEVLVTKRSLTKWEWRVCDRDGATIMGGVETSRLAAKYSGNRALFLLLSTRWILR